MTKKDKIILLTAVVAPFGLTALGIWKAYELYKGKKNDKDIDNLADWSRAVVDEHRRINPTPTKSAREIREQQDRKDAQRRLKAELQRKHLQNSEAVEPEGETPSKGTTIGRD